MNAAMFDPNMVHNKPSFDTGKIVFGGFFGDEGKGKIVDITCADYKKRGMKILSIRGQGSGNAGHTVEVDGVKRDFHYLTSAGLEADIMLLGAGMLIDPIRVLKEAEKLPEERRSILMIDERATVCCDLDRNMDAWLESERAGSGGKVVGTTKSGVGPATAVRAQRDHVTFADALECVDADELYDILINRPGTPLKVLATMTRSYAAELYEAIHKLNIVSSADVITKCRNEGYAVLLEVSQAVLLDPLFGNGGHFVTSTPCTDIGAAAFAGLTLDDFSEGSTMVLKAYSSKVGGGPFPTMFKEDESAIADIIYDIVGERGVTTGRKRNLGWFDGVGVRASIMRTNCKEICINCMDVIPKLAAATDTLKVCWGYRDMTTGKVTYTWPYNLSKYKPLYIEMDVIGKSDSQIITEYRQLISSVIGREINWVGMGPSREDLIKV